MTAIRFTIPGRIAGYNIPVEYRSLYGAATTQPEASVA